MGRGLARFDPFQELGDTQRAMLNQLSMFFGVICCVLGAVLLFGVLSKSDATVLAGAAVMSVGVLIVSSSLRNWLKWKQYKGTRSEVEGKLLNSVKGVQKMEPLEVRSAGQRDTQDRRRSQRVILQVAVLIKAEIAGGNFAQAHAFSAVVNAHGGLLECPLRLTVGQRITLTNPQSGKEADSRVVQVQRTPGGSFTTAFEFAERSPQFWPVRLPPRDWSLTQDLATGNG